MGHTHGVRILVFGFEVRTLSYLGILCRTPFNTTRRYAADSVYMSSDLRADTKKSRAFRTTSSVTLHTAAWAWYTSLKTIWPALRGLPRG